MTGLSQWTMPRVSLAAGGPASTDADLLGHFEEMRELARRLAGKASYGCIGFEGDFRRFWSIGEVLQTCPSTGEPFRRSWNGAVPGAFPYQVLGPGHRARTGTWPSGGTGLDNGRCEVTFGQPSDWLFNSPQRAGLHSAARNALSGLLEDGASERT